MRRSFLIIALTCLAAGGCGGADDEAEAAAPDAAAEAPDAAAVTPDAAAATPDAGARAADGAPDPADAAPDASPWPTCDGDPFVPVQERVQLDEGGLRYQALDGNMNPFAAVIIEIRDAGGAVGPGAYDLTGTNYEDCQVCVTGLRECDPQEGCRKVFYPRAGTVVIDALEEVGGRFVATLHGLELEQVTIDRATRRSTPVARGDRWCNPEQTIDQEVLPRPARLGEIVTDFRLQNCASERMVSLHRHAANALGVWIIASAGWCSACEQFIPQALQAMDNIQRDRGTFSIRPMIIVGEDSAYGRPTLDFCRRYARHFGADPERFYIDHDGQGSFATTFQHMWAYFGPNGEFGLPWNAVVRGRTFEYLHSDRSGQSDLNEALNELLRR